MRGSLGEHRHPPSAGICKSGHEQLRVNSDLTESNEEFAAAASVKHNAIFYVHQCTFSSCISFSPTNSQELHPEIVLHKSRDRATSQPIPLIFSGDKDLVLQESGTLRIMADLPAQAELGLKERFYRDFQLRVTGSTLSSA